MDVETRWEFWVHPGTSWGEHFATHFLSPDIYMWPEETDSVPAYFAWTSPHLNDVADAKELVNRTASLKAVFDGAMYLGIGKTYTPFELSRPSATRPEDRAMSLGLQYPADILVPPFSASIISSNASKIRDPLNHPVARNIFLARYDTMVLALLKFLGVNGLTYFTLYAFRDWMKSGGWDDKRIALEAGWSSARFDDFTNTANNPTYLGPFSRHGGTAVAPKRPMVLDDAQEGMLTAIRKFLLHRCDAIDLKQKWEMIKI